MRRAPPKRSHKPDPTPITQTKWLRYAFEDVGISFCPYAQ